MYIYIYIYTYKLALSRRPIISVCPGSGKPYIHLSIYMYMNMHIPAGIASLQCVQGCVHFLSVVTQGLLPSVVLGCGFSVPVCGFVRTFD